jgi:hypothetical protein
VDRRPSSTRWRDARNGAELREKSAAITQRGDSTAEERRVPIAK